MAKAVTSSTLGCEPDTYLYSLARIGNNSLATIGSDDSLRIFDPSTLRSIASAQPRGSGLSCLQPFDERTLATAGRDGTIRLWDSRAKPITQLAEPQGRPISALACHANILAAGTESNKEGLGDVSVLLYDARNPSIPLRDYAESHADSITQLAFHPTAPHVVLSGSTDGLVSLFDGNEADEDEALQTVFNPRSAVHCAGFLSSEEVYVFTTDEQFLIYPLLPTSTSTGTIEGGGGGDEQSSPTEQQQQQQPRDFGDVREELNCMYVISLLRQPADHQPLIAYGHNEQQRLSVMQLSSSSPSGRGGHGSWEFGPSVDFPGAHGEEVVRDMLVGDGRAWSCGEDGCVRVWKW